MVEMGIALLMGSAGMCAFFIKGRARKRCYKDAHAVCFGYRKQSGKVI